MRISIALEVITSGVAGLPATLFCYMNLVLTGLVFPHCGIRLCVQSQEKFPRQ